MVLDLRLMKIGSLGRFPFFMSFSRKLKANRFFIFHYQLIHSSLKLSDFQQDLNPNYPDTRFVFGYAHDKEIYSLEVEGQKPDGVIEINVYDRTMYLWYYDDLKSY